jgi:hypothetical protein
MTKMKTTGDTVFRQWLFDWIESIRRIPNVVGIGNDFTGYEDILASGNLPQLTVLLKDEALVDSLSKAFFQLRAKVGDEPAQRATTQFLINACWLCKSKPKAVNTIQSPGDRKKDLLNLNKASIKLAKQIEALTSKAGPNSCTYLEERLQSANPVGYALKHTNTWQNAMPAQPTRRLSELLQCFADDIMEEAALLSIDIDAHRQKSGAHADLHSVMDALTAASTSISAADSPKPNFALVNRVIEAMLDPPGGLDPSTARRRFLATQKRKTDA